MGGGLDLDQPHVHRRLQKAALVELCQKKIRVPYLSFPVRLDRRFEDRRQLQAACLEHTGVSLIPAVVTHVTRDVFVKQFGGAPDSTAVTAITRALTSDHTLCVWIMEHKPTVTEVWGDCYVANQDLPPPETLRKNADHFEAVAAAVYVSAGGTTHGFQAVVDWLANNITQLIKALMRALKDFFHAHRLFDRRSQVIWKAIMSEDECARQCGMNILANSPTPHLLMPHFAGPSNLAIGSTVTPTLTSDPSSIGEPTSKRDRPDSVMAPGPASPSAPALKRTRLDPTPVPENNTSTCTPLSPLAPNDQNQAKLIVEGPKNYSKNRRRRRGKKLKVGQSKGDEESDATPTE